MRRNRAWWQHPGVQIGIALVLLIVLGGAAAGIYLTQIPPEQPINFPHRVHVGNGASCLYCHPAASWGANAGIPSTEKCWGCHQQIGKESDELVKLRQYVENGQQIPWVPVAMQPDFVRFFHNTHIDSGINCEECHGPISQMDVAEPQPRQNMGWCLDCHNQMAEDREDWIRLSDCATCHY